MGTLWRPNRNLVSKFMKPKSLTSSEECFFRRILPRVVVGDLNPKSSSFLIEHKVNGIINNTLLSVDHPAADHWRHTRNPFTDRPELFSLVGSCKEMILFSSLLDHKHINVLTQPVLTLWNTRSLLVKTLPPSLLARPGPILSIDFDCIGFGFDPKSRDYKLVCFLRFGGKRISLKNSYDAIEVYSLKTDTWKQITAPPFVVTPYFHLSTLHIKGVHYWARDDILSFDFAEEKFGCISLPPEIRKLVSKFCLAEFHGSLAVISPYSVPAEDLTEREKQLKRPFSVEIWVWNGETWDVGPRVPVGDFPVGDDDDGGMRALFLFRNDYLFLQGCKDTQVMIFNCKTGELKNLGIHSDPWS